MTPPPFNPSQQQWGLYPLNPSKPTCRTSGWDNGCTGYLRGVLRFKAGQTTITVLPNYGPWSYSSGVAQGVRNVQALFGLTVDGVCGPQTWPAIDYLAGL